MAEQALSQVAQVITGGSAKLITGEDETASVESTLESTSEAEGLQSDEPAQGQEAAPTAEETEPGQHEDAAPLTVKALAEKLDMTPEALYSDLSIDVGEGTMTLGDFKDRAKQLVKADDMLADAEAHALESGNAVLRQNRAANQALQRLGRPLTDAELKESDAQHLAYVQDQNRLALAAIPEWKEEGVQTADMALMGKMLVSYGMSPQEISMIADHRLVKMFRDYSSQTERLRLAKKAVVTAKPNQSSRGKAKVTPSKKSAVERVNAGELTQQQGVLAAIADGAKR